MTRKGSGLLRAMRDSARQPARGPLWSREGVFLYPPPGLWSPLSAGAAPKAWRAAPPKGMGPDPLGLYIHFPAEMSPLADFFGRKDGHPYLEALRREAELLKPPRRGPVKTVYLGGGGRGRLSSLSASELEELFAWLRKRFGLRGLEQFAAEADAAGIDEEKARLLKRHGADRVVACVNMPRTGAPAAKSAARRCFRALRRAGIGELSLELRAEGKESGELLSFARSLSPDSIYLNGHGPLLSDPFEPAKKNLQLAYGFQCGASVLGLGWGAVSHARGRLVYSPAESCFRYVESLLRGEPPLYRGARLDLAAEMRSYVIRALEDAGMLFPRDFRSVFGKEPEEAFPREFSRLLKEGRLLHERDRFLVSPGWERRRCMCSIYFYGPRLLRHVSGSKGSR